MDIKLTEIMRLITNLIRTGTVSDVDTVSLLCQVKTGELETNWINWLTFRAGNTRTWWQPSIGEQVVLLSLGGNLETAFALPAIYSDAFPPPDYSESRTYANRSNAERAARMQWERCQRGVATFSIQLARGRADLYTEMPGKVSGFKQAIDSGEWIITTLTHSLNSDNGYTTSIEFEVKIDSIEME